MARILHVFEGPHGGIANHVRALATGLAERGHDQLVAGPEESQAYPGLERAGVPIERLPITGSVKAFRADRSARRAIARLLREGGFEVAHAHGMKAGLLVRPLAPITRVPVVYTPHGFPFIFSEHRDDLRHPRLRRLMALNVERSLGLLTARLICVSEAEREFADRLHIVPAARRRVIHNGADVEHGLAPEAPVAAWRGDGTLFGALSVLRWEKGLQVVLDSAELLADAPEGVRLAIGGDGPLKEEIAGQIERRGLGGRIKLFPTFSKRIESRMGALDGFLIPSDRWEALPIAVIEAMALGLPVIGSRLGGIPELVSDGVTGLLVPPGDPQALAEAVRRLAADPAERRRMGEAGKRRAETEFSLAGMVDRVAALYAEVIAERRPR